MVIRKTFPQIYQLEHPKDGWFWMVSTRSKKWNMTGRRYFGSKKLAEKYAQDIEEQLLNYGRPPEIPKEKIVLAERFEGLTTKLAKFGRTPEDAVEHFTRHLSNEAIRQAKPFVRELADQWEKYKRADKTVTPRYLNEVHSQILFIKCKLGDLKPDDIKRNDIDLLLKGLDVSNNTRRKHRLFIGMFFKWVIDEGHIATNPATGIKFKSEEYQGRSYSPKQTKKLLRYVVETNKDLVGYFALATFAGLRPTEVARVQWEDFNEKTSQLFVRKGKTPARHVDLEPTALAWLKYHRDNTAKDSPFVTVTNLENRMKVIRTAVFNGGWIQDGLRHGFGTYYKALTKDIEKVADQMGNSVAVVKRHYARAIPADECQEFWALTPAIVLADEPAKNRPPLPPMFPTTTQPS
jgi:integrase